jgi:rfaE bifunctional protein kinase chain/domain
LKANVHAISIIGKDQDGNELIELLKSNNINSDYIFQSEQRITTNKIRIISRNQQMMRLDAEITHSILEEEEQIILNRVQQYILKEKPNIIILEDYNKGVLTEKLIEQIISLCKQHQILTAVDPKRKNFFAYKGVDIFKPNLHEVKEALNIISDDSSTSQLEKIHQELFSKLSHHISLITLSREEYFIIQKITAISFPHISDKLQM